MIESSVQRESTSLFEGQAARWASRATSSKAFW